MKQIVRRPGKTNCSISYYLIGACLAGFSTTGAAQATAKIVEQQKVGCTEVDQLNQLASIVGSGDKEASSKALKSAFLFDKCILFSKDDQVFLEEATWTALVKLRKEGETQGYWTFAEAIKK